MKAKKLILGIPLIILIYFLISFFTGILRLPGFSVYKTYPNVLGGCFNICDGNEGLIKCQGNIDDFTDTFVTLSLIHI